MSTIRIDAVVEKDGELVNTDLPYRKGERVEAVLLVPERSGEKEREAARKRFLARARASKLVSPGPYPLREELHERS